VGFRRGLEIALGVASLLACGCVGGGTLGSAPSDPRCGATPRVLVDASSYPVTPGAVTVAVTALAVDGLELYYVLTEAGTPTTSPAGIIPAEAGAVMRVATVGGQPVQVAGGYAFSAPLFTPTSMILGESGIDAGGLDRGPIVSIPLEGGPLTTLVPPQDSSLPQSPLVTDGTFVYFLSESGVEAAPASADYPAPHPTLLTSAHPSVFGVYGQRVLLFFGGDTGEVDSFPVGASDPGMMTTLATGLPDGATATAACGSDVCVLNEPDNLVYEIDPSSGTTRTIAEVTGRFSDTRNMVSDGATLFIEGTSMVSGQKTIARVANDGTPAIPVVTIPNDLRDSALAVDDACVYFATPTGIFSVAKTAVRATVP
jgi:hypothetical protein